MNAKIKITYRDKDGNIIENPEEGQLAHSPETQKLYKYTNGKWEMVTGDAGLNLNMYDLNKQIIAQLPALDEHGVQQARTDILNFFQDIEQEYYMLLSRDIHYYTLFHILDEPKEPISCILDEAWACAEYIGDIKSVSREEGAIEIWVQPRDEWSEPLVMYLFGYDQGVVECIR